ncbi:FRG domain-containing protein [Vibrio parahaemolyticus]|nr:FRG domain-containing protein [Vibrio parahaemolyticus]
MSNNGFTPNKFLEELRQGLELNRSQQVISDDTWSNLQVYEQQIDDFEREHFNDAEVVVEAHQRLKDKIPFGVFDNVYDAATSMLFPSGTHFSINSRMLRSPNSLFHRAPGRYNINQLNNSLEPNDRVKFFYRGLSSSDYENISPLERPMNNSSKLSLGLRAKRLARIEHFRAHLRAKFTLYEDVFGSAQTEDIEHLELAFMQHFKSEAKLAPPLLDITYDPLVALYFASYEPTDGHIGVVYNFSLNDTSRTLSLVGADLRVTIMPDVTRLTRQRALIFEGVSTRTIEAIVPHKLTFTQHENLRFEDPELGIDDLHLLGDDRVAKQFCEDYASQFANQRVPMNAPLVQVQDENKQLFERIKKIAQSLHDSDPTMYPSINLDLLERLAKFHSEAKGSFPDHWTSWHNLEGAVKRIARGREIVPRDYYSWLYNEKKRKINSFIELWKRYFNS